MIMQTQHFNTAAVEDHSTELLVILVPAGQAGFPSQAYPASLETLIEHYKTIGDWHSDSKYLLCINPPKFQALRILLVNTNLDINRADAKRISMVVTDVLEQLNQAKAEVMIPPGLQGGELLIQAFFHASYRFSDYKTKASRRTEITVELLVSDERLNDALDYARALHNGKCRTRDLANMPGNLCTPAYFAECALALDEQFATISTDILDEAQLTELGMDAYLAVGRGSAHPGCMPVIRYVGAEPEEPSIWVIGKGITFDSGGITLKKPPGMQNMIYDMCGGASVIGLMAAVAELKLPVNVTGVIATAENMPDGDAFRPGDILTTMSGQTVEIISTDAEGRLVLCDAITYAKQHQPALIIDVATLTGAQIVSLGSHASGLMGNSPQLNQALQQAGDESGDRAWTMPVWPDYQDALESPFADMRNAGNQSPGMITAGCYLARFAGNTPWAHLDIAGTSFQYGTGNSATGRPLPLLLQFLRNYSNLTAPQWSINTDASGFLP